MEVLRPAKLRALVAQFQFATELYLGMFDSGKLPAVEPRGVFSPPSLGLADPRERDKDPGRSPLLASQSLLPTRIKPAQE